MTDAETRVSTTPYRLKIVGPRGMQHYLTRDDRDDVFYLAASQVVLPLSDLVGEQAAETSFALEDAASGTAAATALQNAINNSPLWPPPDIPQVTVLNG